MSWRKKETPRQACWVQTGGGRESGAVFPGGLPGSAGERRLYDQIRQAVPLVDAAIGKIIRLTGGFAVEGDSPAATRELERFCRQVQVGACGRGMNQFLSGYLGDLLTYGNAVGEMIPFRDGRGIGALYNASLDWVSVREGRCPLEAEIYVYPDGVTPVRAQHPERIVFSALNPPSGGIQGRPVLEGLPFVTEILVKIYDSIGQNFERLGNLRFAVTYRPGSGAVDRGYAREIAQNMADQWAQTMRDASRPRDFVAVGDVDIRVIGADCQMLDTQVPVRQMLEQMVAKLGIPPFILGLSWSTTERMSKQQADILTSELESYRGLLTPVVERICREHLRLAGYGGQARVQWSRLRIADEVEEARARLLQAQARALEQKRGEDGKDEQPAYRDTAGTQRGTGQRGAGADQPDDQKEV